MNKRTVVIGGLVAVLAAGAFVGGALLGPRLPFARGLGGPALIGGPGGVAGPMAQLSEEERAQVANMSDSERQQFFQSKMGDAAPGAGRGGRGGASIEGEVLEASEEALVIKTTAGGSQTVYVDADTTVAYAEGASADGAGVGDQVIAVAQPEGDVMAASAVIVK